MESAKSHTRYEVLDGMRGIAAISVMVFHYTIYTHFFTCRNAFIAVDMFFILSGFVIAHSYSERLRNGSMTFTDFFCRRLIRLYPMFIMGILLGTLMLYISITLGRREGYALKDIADSFKYNIFFLPYLKKVGNWDIFPVNYPAWSLFFELFANLFCVGLVYCSNNVLRALIIACYVLIVAGGMEREFAGHNIRIPLNAGLGTFIVAVAGGIEQELANHNLILYTDVGVKNVHCFAALPRVFYGFILGILLHRLAQGGVKLTAIAPFLKYVAKPFVLYALLAGVFLLPLGWHGFYPVFIISVAAPLLVWLGSEASCTNAVSLNISRFLGWISYPLYCLHLPVCVGMRVMNERFHIFSTEMGWFLASVFAVTTASVFIGKLYDEPIRKYLTKRLNKN